MEKKEIADIIVQITEDYTDIYFQSFPEKKRMDKQLWAALHNGFIAGMKVAGYSEETLMAALEVAHEEMSSWAYQE